MTYINQSNSFYYLVSNGTNVTALDSQNRIIASNADGGAVFTTVLAALPASGGNITFKNNGNIFPWGSVPALPRGITGKLVINGNGATVQLSAGGPRFLDFNKIADHDTFQNIELTDFVIDCNSVGGSNHIVLGTYAAGVTTTRINLAHIRVRRITVINAPVDSSLTNHRLGVWLVVRQAAANEATQNTLTDIVIEDYRQEGGNAAIAVTGTGGSGNAPDLNVLVDNVIVNRWYHTMLSVASVGFASSHVQIGSRAMGGPIGSKILNGYGEYSGDVGIETDQQNIEVAGNTIRDSRNQHYLFTSFNNPSQGANTNVLDIHDNTATAISALTTYHAFSFRVASQTTTVPFGHIFMRDNFVYHKQAAMPGTASALFVKHDDGTIPAGTLRTTFVCERLTANYTGLSAAANSTSPVVVNPTIAGYNEVVLREIDVRYAGAATSGSPSNAIVQVYGTAIDLTIDGVRGDWLGMTGLGTNGSRLVELGITTATTLIGNAIIRRCKYLDMGDATGGFGINLSSANLTISGNQHVLVTECDFTKMAGGTEVALLTANKPFIRLRGNAWRVVPVPAAFTGLVTATGKQLATSWDALIAFTQGSGSGVTAIDYSTNGGTTYTNLLTQAAGALPAGYGQALGPFPSDALVKVTFATTQPTITLVPVNP